MKKAKFILPVVLSIGIVTALNFPLAGNAENNVVLASVEWVQSKLNPINSKISELEAKISKQSQEIASLKEALKNGGQDIPASPTKLYIKSASANIHSGALSSYRVVATKSKGTQLTIVDTHESSSGTWYRVQVTSSLFGWIKEADISFTQVVSNPATVKVTTATNLRRGATTGYAVITTLTPGTNYKYIGEFKNDKGEVWYNIELSDKTRGWVISTYCEVQ